MPLGNLLSHDVLVPLASAITGVLASGGVQYALGRQRNDADIALAKRKEKHEVDLAKRQERTAFIAATRVLHDELLIVHAELAAASVSSVPPWLLLEDRAARRLAMWEEYRGVFARSAPAEAWSHVSTAFEVASVAIRFQRSASDSVRSAVVDGIRALETASGGDITPSYLPSNNVA